MMIIIKNNNNKMCIYIKDQICTITNNELTESTTRLGKHILVSIIAKVM